MAVTVYTEIALTKPVLFAQKNYIYEIELNFKHDKDHITVCHYYYRKQYKI